MTSSSQWREELHEQHRKEKLEMYLYAMKEDLSEWLAGLMSVSVAAESFMSVLDNGIHLCRLANMIQKAAEKYRVDHPDHKLKLPKFVATYKERGATYGSFVSRDNVANFIRWCRELGIPDVIIFESEDLVLHRYQKPVILTLLDVARRAAKFDVEPPDLVKMEEEIDEEIALEQEAIEEEHNITNDNQETTTIIKRKRTNIQPKSKKYIPKNLDTLVKETVQQCTCRDNQFPVEKIADGKYTIGQNRVLIFVRVMRNHVMVRVGGGWDTLENYIQKHDPCRAGGRSSSVGRHKSRCHTPNHINENSLHSASNTSVASSDSSSSTSSLPRLSPNSSASTSLQSMVCVFGETGPRTEMLSGDNSPCGTPPKRFEPSVKSDGVTKRSASTAKTTKGTNLKQMATKHKSLTDLTSGQKGKENIRNPTVNKRQPITAPENRLNSMSTSSIRKSLQNADLTFERAKTSDAILSRTKRRRNTDSSNAVVKRRGAQDTPPEGTLQKSPHQSRPKTTGGRRKSVDGRKKSPEVRKRSTVSPSPARRRLELEYDTKAAEQKRSVLRKDLYDNDLLFSRSFSADAIRSRRGHGGDRFENGGFPRSRIPMPIASYGKPRGARWATQTPQEKRVLSGKENTCPHENTNSELSKCNHCGQCCNCDEGFIDGDISRSSPRPITLFSNSKSQNDFEEKSLNPRRKDTELHNGDSKNNLNGSYECCENDECGSWKVNVSGNGVNPDDSLEWKEVVTDILNFEENRIADKRL